MLGLPWMCLSKIPIVVGYVLLLLPLDSFSYLAVWAFCLRRRIENAGRASYLDDTAFEPRQQRQLPRSARTTADASTTRRPASDDLHYATLPSLSSSGSTNASS